MHPASKGSMLLLHYRWQHDSLTLIQSERVPAAVKASRIHSNSRVRGQDVTSEEPRSAFSYDLLDADGKRISTRYLQDPGLRRVEYQLKGERILKSQEERVDSADIFLRIPESEARTIRFFRHAEAGSRAAQAAGPTPAAKRGAQSPMQGPGPQHSKSLLAEFPLE